MTKIYDSAPIAQSPLRQAEPIYRRESPVEQSRHSSPLENEAMRQSGRISSTVVNEDLPSTYVEPTESDGDKYTKDSIATEKQKSGSPVNYNYSKNEDIERDTSLSNAQSYVSKQPPTATEPQYSINQHDGTVDQYEQPVEYNAPSGYESNANNSATNQQLYDSNYTTEEQPKYEEQSYEQYAQQPYDETYNAGGAYDQQQYDQQQYDQQQYDPQQYDTSQQYQQYPTTDYDPNYTNQTAYQSEQLQQPIVNQSTLSGYTESAPSSGTVGQEYTGTRIEPKTQTTIRQQPQQLLPKQPPQT